MATALIFLTGPVWLAGLVYFLKPILFKDSGTILIMQFYNVLASALAITAGLGLAAFMVKALLRGRGLFQSAFFLVAAWGVGVLFNVASPLTFAVVLSAAFLIGFPAVDLARRKKRRFLPAVLLLLVYLGLILCWTVLSLQTRIAEGIDFHGNPLTAGDFLFDVGWLVAAWIIFFLGWLALPLFIGDDQGRRQVLMIRAGRIAVCAVGFFLVVVAQLTARPYLSSDKVTRLIAVKNLYDAQIDPVADRLLVTAKRNLQEQGVCSGFVFDLKQPTDEPRIFRLQTMELENIALDHRNRRIYHLKRDVLELLEIDADSYRVIRSKKAEARCTGSTEHTLAASANRLFVRCEDDSLLAFNTESLDLLQTIEVGQGTDIIADDRHGRLYISYDERFDIEALAVDTLKVLAKEAGPTYADKMVLSAKRNELYVPAALESAVWVYSIPDLKKVRVIPAPFGVRPVAVDERNDLLLMASYVTGEVNVVSLTEQKVVARYNVARYGRTLAVDPIRRQAFLTTTKQGLFLLNY